MSNKEELVIELSEEEAEQRASQIRSMMNCTPEELYKKYRAYKKAEKAFMDLYEPFKEKLIGSYDDEGMPKSIVVGGLKCTYVSPSVRTTIDTKKLKEEEPELAKKFTKTTNVGATIKLSEA